MSILRLMGGRSMAEGPDPAPAMVAKVTASAAATGQVAPREADGVAAPVLLQDAAVGSGADSAKGSARQGTRGLAGQSS